MKTEPGAGDEMDEIARMVQAVQASVMKEFLSAPHPNIEREPDPEPGPELAPALALAPDREPKRERASISESRIEQSVEVFETTEHEQADIEAALEAALDQQRSPSGDAEPRPDTLWNNPRDYTRRKHIIPALGALVSASRPEANELYS